MFVLFVSEFNYYLTKEVTPELFVDTTRGQKLRINIDVTFPRMACDCKCVPVCILNSRSSIVLWKMYALSTEKLS